MARKRSTAGWAALAATMLIAGFPAAAQTVYKLIDKNGRVTYSNEEPKDFDGKVIRIDIDPNANKANLGDTGGAAAAQTRANLKAIEAAKAQSRAEQIQAARERLAAAQAALADARDNPVEGVDVQFIGNKSGGTRPVPTEQYQQRLAKLEQAVKEAENELHKLDGNM
jgi:hypothetical protein